MKTITPRELAERWGLSEGTLCDKRTAGVGPAWSKVGRRIEYQMADVLDHERRRDAELQIDRGVLDDKLLRVDEIAKLVGVSTKTVRHWSRIGQLPAPLRLSSTTRRWSRRAVLQWLAEAKSA